jgi:integrase
VRNVADAVNIPKKEKKEITVLTVESQKKLIDAAYNHEYGIAVHIAIMTGMRLSEVLALTWDDIDFQKCEIKVNKNLQRVKVDDAPSKVIIQNSTKTKAGNRIIPLHQKLQTILKNYNPTNIRPFKNKFVISDKFGNPIEPKRMINYFNDIVKDADIERVTFHALRHTFATRGLENGVDAKVMQEILGHTSITMTLDLYSHVLPNTKQAAIDRLKNAF